MKNTDEAFLNEANGTKRSPLRYGSFSISPSWATGNEEYDLAFFDQSEWKAAYNIGFMQLRRKVENNEQHIFIVLLFGLKVLRLSKSCYLKLVIKKFTSVYWAEVVLFPQLHKPPNRWWLL